jgi:CheY-like chemotaxis protein
MKTLLLVLTWVPALAAFASPIILIVDSSPGSAASQAIEKGFPEATVLEVASGGEAVKRLESFYPDVIVVGGISGAADQDEWKTMVRVQNEKPGIPVIKIGTLETTTAEEKVKEAGGKFPHGYLRAPFKDEDLVALVTKVSGEP